MRLETRPSAAGRHGTARTAQKRSVVWAARWDRVSVFLTACAKPLCQAFCAFLLSFVSWVSIPAPFAPALMMAHAARGEGALFSLMGVGAAQLLVLLWGMQPDLWLLGGCALCALMRRLRAPKGDVGYSLLAALATLPRAIAMLAGDATIPDVLLAVAAAPVALCGTVAFKQGLSTLYDRRPMLTLREQLCAALLVLLLVSGGGFLRLWEFNLGQMMATYATLLCAHCFGCFTGSAAGLLAGCALALGGHDSRLALMAALGGMLSGLYRRKRKRWLGVALFLGGVVIGFYLTPLGMPPLSPFALAAACAAYLLTNTCALDRVRALGGAPPRERRSAENAFVQARLSQWEGALRAMSLALPQASQTPRLCDTAQELRELLCAKCGERSRCWGADRDATQSWQSELLRAAESGEAELENCLLTLMDVGCVRLHAAEGALTQLQKRHQERLATKLRMRFGRDMTVTHLEAMAAMLSELRQLTAGETAGDVQAAYQINKAIRELDYPARLIYARRVGGRLQVALEPDATSPGRKQNERLLSTLQADFDMQLELCRTSRNRLEFEEAPLYSVEIGVAAISFGERGEENGPGRSGDAVAAKQLAGGRFLLLLSDGMGHGEAARRCSDKTLELLMHCMEAGYTRKQAITAVNGMMLSVHDDERFATVDLFDLSLWTGDARSEKLGACASYVVRGNYVKRVEGSSLPLGILENVAPTSQGMRLHSGDILVMTSDGVEEAFDDPKRAERAILDCLYIQPQRMADAFLRAALLAAGGTPRDDMTVVTMLMMDHRRSGVVA